MLILISWNIGVKLLGGSRYSVGIIHDDPMIMSSDPNCKSSLHLTGEGLGSGRFNTREAGM